jgi:hypothetical protein
MAVEMRFGFVFAVKSRPSPTACANVGRREEGTGYQRRGGVEQAMRFHPVDGYVALKHPAPGSRFCASERCQESIELALLPDELAAVPAGGNDCVELEHADSAADRTAIEVSRGKFNSLTFQWTAWRIARITTTAHDPPFAFLLPKRCA